MSIRPDEVMIVNGNLIQCGKSFVAKSKRCNQRYAVFECVCGNRCIKILGNGKSKRTKSCGCVKKFKESLPKKTIHGMATTKIYRAWAAMKQRCSNPKCKVFHHYGGRGIGFCDRWNDFNLFLEDVGIPEDGLTLDRIDNNASYCKENCRWITQAEQLRNTRSNVLIEYKGQVKCASEWAREFGMLPRLLINRLRKMSFEAAVSTPIKRKPDTRTQSWDHSGIR